VPLAQQYRGHPAAACLDDEPEHVPDVAVRRVHVITAEHLVLIRQLIGDGVDGHGLRDRPRGAWRCRQHAARSVIGPRGRRSPHVAVGLVALIAREQCLLGGSQLLVLGPGAAQPDLALSGIGSPDVDEAERDNPGGRLPAHRLHH
jgi:hypothetical protein